jgi:hypothetical protein
MTDETDKASQSSETAQPEQPTTGQTHNREPWWRKDPAGNESSLDHSNMNPDNLTSNDL